jgi:hypothetical protein
MFIGWSSTKLRFLFRYEIQNGGYGRTYFNIGSYGENVSKRFFSETTRIIETKLMNSLALLTFVVSEKKAFEHFHIGSNVNLCIAEVAILDFRST